MNDLARRRDITQASIDRPTTPVRRTLPQNARFHALLGDWAQRSGQSAPELKNRVKDFMGEFTDVEVPNDPLTDRLLDMFARLLLALGKPDLMRVLPSARSVRFYHTSRKWPKDKMARAMDAVFLLAGQEGVALDISTWDRTA